MKVLIKDCDYTTHNKVYIDLRVYSLSRNTSSVVTFTYDTGAMRTIINFNDLEDIGCPKESIINTNKSMIFKGFDQLEQELYSIRIPLIRLGDFEVRNYVVYVDFKNQVSNLLGYDLLKYFNRGDYPELDNGNTYDTDYEEDFNLKFDDDTPEEEQGRLYFSVIPKYRRRFKNILLKEIPNRLTILYNPYRHSPLQRLTKIFKKDNELNSIEIEQSPSFEVSSIFPIRKNHH